MMIGLCGEGPGDGTFVSVEDMVSPFSSVILAGSAKDRPGLGLHFKTSSLYFARVSASSLWFRAAQNSGVVEILTM